MKFLYQRGRMFFDMVMAPASSCEQIFFKMCPLIRFQLWSCTSSQGQEFFPVVPVVLFTVFKNR